MQYSPSTLNHTLFAGQVFLSLMNHQTLHMNQQKSCHLEETLTAREKRGKGNTVPSP